VTSGAYRIWPATSATALSSTSAGTTAPRGDSVGPPAVLLEEAGVGEGPQVAVDGSG
jgi:hypothetical protein